MVVWCRLCLLIASPGVQKNAETLSRLFSEMPSPGIESILTIEVCSLLPRVVVAWRVLLLWMHER